MSLFWCKDISEIHVQPFYFSIQIFIKILHQNELILSTVFFWEPSEAADALSGTCSPPPTSPPQGPLTQGGFSGYSATDPDMGSRTP